MPKLKLLWRQFTVTWNRKYLTGIEVSRETDRFCFEDSLTFPSKSESELHGTLMFIARQPSGWTFVTRKRASNSNNGKFVASSQQAKSSRAGIGRASGAAKQQPGGTKTNICKDECLRQCSLLLDFTQKCLALNPDFRRSQKKRSSWHMRLRLRAKFLLRRAEALFPEAVTLNCKEKSQLYSSKGILRLLAKLSSVMFLLSDN